MKPKGFVIATVMILAGLGIQRATANENDFSSSMLRQTHLDSHALPIVELDILALQSGQPVHLDQETIHKKLAVMEDAVACSLISCQSSLRKLSLDVDLFADLDAVTKEELNKFENIVLAVSSHSGFKTRLHTYALQDSGLTELPLGEFNRLKLDSRGAQTLSLDKALEFIRQQTSFSTGNHIIFFLLRYTDEQAINRLRQTMLSLNDRGTLWYGVIYTKAVDIGKGDMPLDHCVILEDLGEPEDQLRASLVFFLDRVQAATYAVQFLSPNKRSLRTTRVLDVTVCERCETDGSQKMSWVVTYPDSVVKKAYVRFSLENAEVTKTTHGFQAALDTLYNAFRWFAAPEFQDAAQSIIGEWGKCIISQRLAYQVDQLRRQAENDWGIAPDHAQWYRELKRDMLNTQLAASLERGDSLDVAISLRDQIGELYPHDTAYLAETQMLRGDLLVGRADFWGAARSYERCQQLRPDKQVDKKLIETIRQGMLRDDQDHNYKRMYVQGKTFTRHFSADVQMRYLFARCCNMTGDFSLALENYEWLVVNWNGGQGIVTWDGLFQELQQMYSSTLRFDEAYRLDQRVFRQREDNMILFQAVRNLRARYLMPVASVFPLFWSRVDAQESRAKFFQKNVLTLWPHFLLGMYVINHGEVGRFAIGDSKKRVAPSTTAIGSASGYPSIINGGPEGQTRAWLVNRIPEGYFVLEFSDDVDDREGIMLGEIKKRKMLDEPWNALANYEQSFGVRTLSELLTGMLTAEYEERSSLSLSAYLEPLRKVSPIIYLVHHTKGGQINESSAFDRPLAQYAGNNWIRSSTTLAFMVQELDYNKNSVIDAANPMYIDRAWKGVIRVGFRKF